MSSPSKGGWSLVKRIARYLLRAPEADCWYRFDAGGRWARHFFGQWLGVCINTRGSTSGGLATYCGYVLESWSSTQAGWPCHRPTRGVRHLEGWASRLRFEAVSTGPWGARPTYRIQVGRIRGGRGLAPQRGGYHETFPMKHLRIRGSGSGMRPRRGGGVKLVKSLAATIRRMCSHTA